ncbi:MAG: alpha/beta fold hydrolase, partial [Stellaceae bacterium]
YWEAQPETGNDFSGLRRIVLARADLPEALELFPDSRSDIPREVERYTAMRFASRNGFSPPYFYNRKLRSRLHRFPGPALLLWGEHDRMVPRAHAEAYRAGLKDAALHIVKGTGHSMHVEAPRETAAFIRRFLAE